jgi:hypothetical protein
MKQLRFFILHFCIISLLFAGCSPAPGVKDSDYHIIDVKGSSIVLNYSKSPFDFGSVSLNEGDTLSFAIPDGDLLYVFSQDLSVLIYRYRADDGKNLSFGFDTMNYTYSLNGETISLLLTDDSGAWNWIEQQNGTSLQSIRSLSISLPVRDGGYEYLRRIADVNPDPGLYISGDGPADELFNIFSPKWIFAEDMPMERISGKAQSNLSGTELLICYCGDAGSIDFLNDLPGLHSLVLGGCRADAVSELSLERLTGLSSLCLFESDIQDLSYIGPLTGLSSIDLVECENLISIEALQNFRDLKSLGISDCDHIQDIAIINEVPGLERLSLTSDISQADFEAIIAGQPNLKVLELIYCENITDLSPLKGISGLEVLTIGLENADLSPLYGMQNLELLTLEQEFFEDSLLIETMKRALPDTRIVPGGTFCLGSGWLLLLIPVILTWVALKKWIRAAS